MYAVRMQFSAGACCATGEMCGFSSVGPSWFAGDHWTRDKPRTLRDFDSLNHQALERDGYSHSNPYYYGKGETIEEAWQNCLKGLAVRVQGYSYNGHQVRYFWFVNYRGDDGYENDALRKIVQAMPGVVALGEYVNANSSNKVDGYLVPFENTHGEEPEDEEYDD